MRGLPLSNAISPKKSPLPSRTRWFGRTTSTAPEEIRNIALPRSPLRITFSSGTSSRGRKRRASTLNSAAPRPANISNRASSSSARSPRSSGGSSSISERTAACSRSRSSKTSFPINPSSYRSRNRDSARRKPDCRRKRCSSASAYCGYCRRRASSARVVASLRAAITSPSSSADPLTEQRCEPAVDKAVLLFEGQPPDQQRLESDRDLALQRPSELECAMQQVGHPEASLKLKQDAGGPVVADPSFGPGSIEDQIGVAQQALYRGARDRTLGMMVEDDPPLSVGQCHKPDPDAV